jgi:hypothetical protein
VGFVGTGKISVVKWKVWSGYVDFYKGTKMLHGRYKVHRCDIKAFRLPRVTVMSLHCLGMKGVRQNPEVSHLSKRREFDVREQNDC